MRFGQRFPGSGPDPLFVQLFVLATSVNFLPAALGFEDPIEVGVIAVVHLMLIYRLRTARGASARQRTEDLQRFEQLRTEHNP
jgi:hypothetical protein